MAALAKDRNTPVRAGDLFRAPVKTGVTIYAGALVAKAAGNYAAPASKAAALVMLGRAEESVDNSAGVDGAVDVLIRRGTFRWANSAGAAAVGKTEIGEKKAFALDDQTVTKTPAGATAVGKVISVDSEGVWVETR